MRAGKMRNKIVIQQNSPSRGEDGSVTEAWSTYTNIWAEKKHQTSREFFSAQKINSEVTDLFTVRFNSGITTKMRVSFDGKYYNIIGADDPDGRRKETYLVCKAVE